MPYEIISLPKGKVMVINRLTGKIHSKSTTLDKAEKQIRLLQHLDTLKLHEYYKNKSKK